MRTAILIDGAFFLKRFPIVYRNDNSKDSATVVDRMYEMCLEHIYPHNNERYEYDLFRIYFYDCVPDQERSISRPISKDSFDFTQSQGAKFRLDLHKKIKKKRKVALRLGKLKINYHSPWKIHPKVLESILNQKKRLEDLIDGDFQLDIQQKGVDMEIGLDIASLSQKRLVDKIILVAGDSDFVPAAKFARNEGIDFVLDPMWNYIHDDLFEHIDGLSSKCPKPTEWKSSIE